MQRYLSVAPNGLLPIGVDKNKLEVVSYPILLHNMTWVVSESGNNTAFAQGVAEVADLCDVKVIVFDPASRFINRGSIQYEYVNTKEQINSSTAALFTEILNRHKQLKAHSGETFPPVFCIVTSMNDYLSLLDDAVKKDILDALANLKTSFNVHFVVCDSINYYNTTVSQNWAKPNTTNRDAIFIGNGAFNPVNQYKLKIDKKPDNIRETLPEGFGTVIKNGSAVQCKLLVPVGWQSEDYYG